VLLLDEPTRGIDVNAKSEIYRLISELALSGMGVVMVSPRSLRVTNALEVKGGNKSE